MDDIELQINKYLDLGLHPIPLIGKVAKYHWTDFTLKRESIASYIKNMGNWGLRTDKIKPGLYFYVIDLDVKDKLLEFWEANDLPPHTPIVGTGRGYHFYLTWNSEVKTKHYEGLDIIGNGYVVAPPSIHANGKKYKFIRSFETLPAKFDPELIQPLKSTTTIVSHSRGSQAPQQITGSLGSFIRNGAPQGMRHTVLVKYIGAMVKNCFREEEALEKLLEWNAKNKPPLDQQELLGTLRYCYEKYG